MASEIRGRLGPIVGLAVGVMLIWYFWGGGLEKDAATEMQHIERSVASDAVQEYQIAKRQGDPMQICVQAGLVSAAYLQAKDETNYRIWKETEHQDCAAVGITQN